MKKLTAERLREILHYDEETGIFTWKIIVGYRTHVGDVAGSKTRQGYIRIGLMGNLYRAHRLAWLYVFGKDPVNQIDHINLNKSDNRIANIREVTNQQNAQNQYEAQKNNKSSGLRGVSLRNRDGKWRAQIKINGTLKHLGYFDTKEDAHSEYRAMKVKLHPFFSAAI